jgi:hypothetical protein
MQLVQPSSRLVLTVCASSQASRLVSESLASASRLVALTVFALWRQSTGNYKKFPGEHTYMRAVRGWIRSLNQIPGWRLFC